MRRLAWYACIATVSLTAVRAAAQEPAASTLDSGDTAWMLASAALVLFMTPGATIAYSCIATFILLRIVGATMGLRAGEEEEVMGLDLSQHGERAYSL